MTYVYAVLGSGRQGTAAAYDMARFGEAKRVVFADLDLGVAERSAARVNRLLDREVAHACRVDVTEPQQLEAMLREVDGFVSAVPYWLNPRITTAAIKAIMTVHGDTPPGVHPAEIAVPPTLYVEELRRRGFAPRESFHAR